MSADLPFDIVELVRCETAEAPTHRLAETAFRRDAWSGSELARLRELFEADEPLSAIATALGRGAAGVSDKIYSLGMRRNTRRPWLPEEEAELVARYGEEPAASIALSLGRGVSSVYVKAQLLGLSEEDPPRWSEWELAQLRAGYDQGIPLQQLAVLVGRTLFAVNTRASHLGLKHPSHPPDWDEREMSRALELAEEGHRYIDIIEMLVAEGWPRRTKAGFGPKIRKLGYGRGWGRPWEPDEDELLRRVYAQGTSRVVLASKLGRTNCSVNWRAEHLGLRGTHAKKDGWRGAIWTDADIELLRTEFGKTPSKDLAKKLGRTPGAMFSRAHFLGLHHGYIRMFTPDDRRAIGICWRLGLPLAVVAKALGRDPAVISKQAIKIGIPFDSPDRPVLPTRAVRKTWPSYSLEQILELLPPDPDFDGRLERKAAEIEERARANRSAGASRKGHEYRERLGIAA